MGLEVDQRTNYVANDSYQTNNPKIFTAGDMRRGQSLIKWAISEGREAARCRYFPDGKQQLPSKGDQDQLSAYTRFKII